ncbi:transcriptional regulator [Mycobacteroides abscessus subsp. massiliense]|nr:transcriptional regulator [Mycobacteroides abscessus subsp. massiliense]SLG80567.1 transcriptional regulator [Mycobacteroides abscessus subsp. massiliense]
MRKNDAVESAQSARRALRLVLMLAQAGQLRVSEVSNALGVAPSTAHRLLTALEQEGMAARSSFGRRYVVGPQFVAATTAALERDRILTAAAVDELQALAQRTGETAHLVRRRELVTDFIYAADCDRGLRVGSRAGVQLPAHATAGGKALLALLGRERVDALYEGFDWPVLTARTIRCLSELQRELALVAERGWAVNDGEAEDGIRAVGVAIDHPAEVQAAAVVIAAPASRVSGGDIEYLAHELESTAASIAQAWQDMNPIAFSRG